MISIIYKLAEFSRKIDRKKKGASEKKRLFLIDCLMLVIVVRFG